MEDTACLRNSLFPIIKAHVYRQPITTVYYVTKASFVREVQFNNPRLVLPTCAIFQMSSKNEAFV